VFKGAIAMVQLLILGLFIAQGEAYPYQLLQLIRQRHYDAFITITKGSFYYNIDVLEEMGALAVTAYLPTKNAFVSKTSYVITDQGRALFKQLAAKQLLKPDKFQSPSALGLLLASDVAPDVLSQSLAQHVADLERECQSLEKALQVTDLTALQQELLQHRLTLQKSDLNWYQKLQKTNQ
jgi:DNA-binding PadR family transcriptional regulator